MNKELKYWAMALLVMAAVLMGFMYHVHTPSTNKPTPIAVESCKKCGKPVYTEELDYFQPMFIGDLIYFIPIYKTVLHTCKTK